MRLPDTLADLLTDAVQQRVRKAVLRGARGVGKTLILGLTELSCAVANGERWKNMAGSLLQAQRLNAYVHEHGLPQPGIRELIQRETATVTTFRHGGALEVLPCTAKAAHGGHVQGLAFDEVCDMDDAVVRTAEMQVTTAPNPAILKASTFHMDFGDFAYTWDNADDLGYQRITITQLDVAVSRGGHIPDANIESARRRLSEEQFGIEVMADRPTSSGHVYDPVLVDAAVQPCEAHPHAVSCLGLDWGMTGTSVATLAQDLGPWRQVVETWAFSHRGQVGRGLPMVREIEETLRPVVVAYAPTGLLVYADSSNLFEIEYLQDAWGIEVVPVVFSRSKALGVENIRWHLQQGALRIDPSCDDTARQLKGMRRVTQGEVVTQTIRKGNDDFHDSLLCALLPFAVGSDGDNGLAPVLGGEAVSGRKAW